MKKQKGENSAIFLHVVLFEQTLDDPWLAVYACQWPWSAVDSSEMKGRERSGHVI